MATEEQTQHNTISGIDGTDEFRAGQQLTISSRIVSKLAFKLIKVGSPTGDVTFTIRKISDASIIISKVWGDASSLPTSYPATAWQEVEFDTPILVNEEVWLFCEFAGGDSSNQVAIALQSTDVKADEYFFLARFGNVFDKDATYRYTYGVTFSAVTTQAMTDIVTTTATGNGNVTGLGDPVATQHGHCWNTTGTPTTSDSKTTNGVPSATGAFTSSLTSLTEGTLYYVRAYITNSAGTSYGGEVNFTAGSPRGGELAGLYAVVEERFHYVDAYGVERHIQGTPV